MYLQYIPVTQLETKLLVYILYTLYCILHYIFIIIIDIIRLDIGYHDYIILASLDVSIFFGEKREFNIYEIEINYK